MSLIDMLLGQKIILLSAGFAVLIFFAAIMLALIPRIKRGQAKRAQERAERAAVKAAQMELEAEEAAAQAEKSKPRRRQVQPSVVQQPTVPAPATAVPAAAIPQPGQPPKPAEAAKPTEQSPAAAAQPEASADIQNILSAVFQDDEALERYEVLLRGLEPVSASDLLELSRTVSDQLHGRTPVQR